MAIIKPHSILTLPPAEAEALINDLPLAEQASLVLMAPWERRQEIIILSRESRALVQGLPVEELFWTVKAVGPQDAVHILNLANAEQLQFIFDLDWWHKAELLPEKIATWILLLFEAGEDAMASWLQWLKKKDETLLPAILRPFIQVYKRPDDMDIQEAKDMLPLFTLDNVYFVSFQKDALQPIWDRFLVKILDVSPGLYRDVLETIIGESAAENLENAFRLRRSRIGDWGLPDYYDALDIYAPLRGNYVRQVEISFSEEEKWPDTTLPAFVPTLYMGSYPVLRTAIEKLSGTRIMERVVHEWAGAANKILMVDEVDLDDPEALRDSLLKVAALLNLGLEVAGRTEGRSPEEVLKSGVIEDIIRLANTAIRRLAAKARSLVSSGLVSRDFLHLPEAWADTLKGLLSERPMLWDPALSKYRPFCDMTELTSVENLITTVGEWALLMACILPQHGNWTREIPWDSTNLGHPNELVLPQALLTALGQKTLGGELKVYPISAEKLNYLRSIWFPDSMIPSFSGKKKSSGPDEPPPETIRRCVEALRPVAKQTGLARKKLYSMVKESLTPLYKEWRDLPEDVPIDGRFVSSVIVNLEDNQIYE